jgi:hypothetical protein
VRAAASKRNSYVHKLWLLQDGKVYLAEQLGFEFPYGQKRLIHTGELEQALRQVHDAAIATSEFVKEYTVRHPLRVQNAHAHPSLLKKQPVPPPGRNP